MEQPPKLSVNISNSLCEILKAGIAKLQLIQTFLVDTSDEPSSDIGTCHRIIDVKTFLPCKSIQGVLNQEKFLSDSQDLIQLLEELINELKTSQTFEVLMKNVDESSKELLDFDFIMRNFNKQKKAVSKLKGILHVQKEYDQQKLADTENELFNQRIQHRKNQLDVEMEKNYNQSLVAANLQQNETKLSNEKDRVSKDLLDVTFKTYEAEDVYFKTCKFYNGRLKQLNDEIARMNIEYDTQLEKNETEFHLATNEKRAVQALIKLEHEKFAQREREMNDWQETKRKKAEDRKLREIQEIKIVIIQAWWRGVMVRQNLGSFRAFKKRAKIIKKEFQALKAKRKKKKSK